MLTIDYKLESRIYLEKQVLPLDQHWWNVPYSEYVQHYEQ